MSFAITRSERDGRRWLLHLAGELDLATRPTLTRAGEDALGTTITALHLDMSQVTFIDSSGISALVQLHNQAGTLGKQVVVTSPSARVERLLEIMGLLALFTDAS